MRYHGNALLFQHTYAQVAIASMFSHKAFGPVLRFTAVAVAEVRNGVLDNTSPNHHEVLTHSAVSVRGSYCLRPDKTAMNARLCMFTSEQSVTRLTKSMWGHNRAKDDLFGHSTRSWMLERLCKSRTHSTRSMGVRQSLRKLRVRGMLANLPEVGRLE